MKWSTSTGRSPLRRSSPRSGSVVRGPRAAASAAAWSAAEPTDAPRGATIGLSVDFLRAARAGDLEAGARVLRRGRSVCFCEVDVRLGDELVAKGLVSYKLGA